MPNHTTQMSCAHCGYAYSTYITTNRTRDSQSIRRGRKCLNCHHGFVTYEIRASDYALLQALKKYAKGVK